MKHPVKMTKEEWKKFYPVKKNSIWCHFGHKPKDDVIPPAPPTVCLRCGKTIQAHMDDDVAYSYRVVEENK